MDKYSLLIFFHVAGIALWTGTFLTQAVLLGGVARKLDDKRQAIASVGRKLYLMVQAPAMAVVLATGITQMMMYMGDIPDYMKDNKWLHWKIMLVLVLLGLDHVMMRRLVKLAKGKTDEIPASLTTVAWIFGGLALVVAFLGATKPF